MGKISADQIARFERLLHTFATVERVAHISGRNLRENDAEHSYFVTMLAWYIIDALQLPLNKDVVLRYALIHDLVETYAGDTYIFDTEALKTKNAREEAAGKRLQEEFPEFTDLHATIHTYEAQEDPESRFIKALDKLEPVVANFIQKGRTWKEMGVAFDDMVSNKRPKVAQQKEIQELLEQFIALIEPHEHEFFSQ